MFEYCPMVNKNCPYAATYKGEKHCGLKTGSLYAGNSGIRNLMHTSCTYIDGAHNTTSSTTWDIQFRCNNGGGLGYSTWWMTCDFTIMELAS